MFSGGTDKQHRAVIGYPNVKFANFRKIFSQCS